MKNVLFILLAVIMLAALSACQNENWVSQFQRQDIPVSKAQGAGPATNQSPAETDDRAVATTQDGRPGQTMPADFETIVPATQPATDGHAGHSRQGRQAGRSHSEDSATTGPLGKEIFSASAMQVNNQYLSIDEIVRSQSEQLKAIPKGVTEEKFRLKASEILADETRRQVSECLILKEANARVTDEVRTKIDAEVEQTQRVMIAEIGGGSKVRLEKVLIDQGTTLETVLNNYRRRVIVQAYMHDKLQAEVKINRTRLWDYYTKHQDDFAQAKRVQMQTISVPLRTFLPEGVNNPTQAEKDLARKQARERIDQAAGELKAGKRFADVAQSYSKDAKAPDGGLWPLMPAGSFRDPKVEAAAFEMTQGQVSGVIEGESGWYIVMAVQVVPGRITSFEDAQQTIETKLRDEQERDLTEQYFNKLLENSTIVQYNKFLEMAVERAVERFYDKQ